MNVTGNIIHQGLQIPSCRQFNSPYIEHFEVQTTGFFFHSHNPGLQNASSVTHSSQFKTTVGFFTVYVHGLPFSNSNFI